ncbi:MAG: hypothetical protein JNM40_03315 [Myxococcales bacterium]|nr:hypothetical protein [Myxococcales bacterium]
MSLLDQPFGFAGERKAVSILCLSFYTALYSLLALLFYLSPPGQPEREWVAPFAALSLTYGLAFFALSADWFWARWYAIGLGYSGLTVALWGMVTAKSLDPVLLFYGATHGIVTLFLQGQKLSEHFDGQTEWRKLLRVDEQGVEKVGHTVTRAAASLPTLILMALAPKEGASALLVLACVGLLAVLRNRTAGVLMMLGAGLLLPLSLLHSHGVAPLHNPTYLQTLLSPGHVHQLGLLSSVMLIAASAPFLRPALRFLRGQSA